MKEKWRIEKEKLSHMSTEDKLWYIWAYYKIPILLAALAVFLLFQAGAAVFRSMQDTMLYVAFIDQTGVDARDGTALKKDFETYQGYTGWRQQVTFDTGLEFTDDSYGEASLIRFQSLLGTDTLDAVIADRSLGDTFLEQDILLGLDTVLPQERLDALDGEGLLVYEGETPIALLLEDSLLSESCVLAEDSCLYVCTLENHPEVIADFITYLYPGI